MKFANLLAVCVALSIVSSVAHAFQEQQGTTIAPANQSRDKSSAPAGTGSVELATPDAKDKAAVGTEVRIPGLGKLGVLPKMDFGLELLYGAAEEERSTEAKREDLEDPDALRIRGTVKHRF